MRIEYKYIRSYDIRPYLTLDEYVSEEGKYQFVENVKFDPKRAKIFHSTQQMSHETDLLTFLCDENTTKSNRSNTDLGK